MKRKGIYVLCLVLGGILSYYSGYRVYVANNPKTEYVETKNLRKGMFVSDSYPDTEEYYIGKIEQDLLVIYLMPEGILYDSVRISDLHFYGNEEDELTEGKKFMDLTEVYEFLENSMS